MNENVIRSEEHLKYVDEIYEASTGLRLACKLAGLPVNGDVPSILRQLRKLIAAGQLRIAQGGGGD